MALNLPSVKHKPQHHAAFEVDETSLGTPRPLCSGLNSVRSQLATPHPLESSIKHFHADTIKLNNSVMLNAQGPAGPMIHAMERRAAGQIGRLPFLASSNFQLDILIGRDEVMDFGDILNTSEFQETHVLPYVAMENLPKKLF